MDNCTCGHRKVDHMETGDRFSCLVIGCQTQCERYVPAEEKPK